jgi:pyruvate/2-oxoglutarate dehydrogenase complex dihydrolipoamide dehydrogenase (E3) component
MGAKVALVERAQMGGECLNTGCIPSKALIAAAHWAHAWENGLAFGVHGTKPSVDFGQVHTHVHDVIAAIAPHDSVERFQGLGVEVIKEHGRFVGRNQLAAGSKLIRARRFVVATGSRPASPPIPDLDQVPYLTNETIFDLTERPGHLLVLGGGPIGVELAQAFRRLGSRVTVFERDHILPRDEPEAVAVVRKALLAEGIELFENAAVAGVSRRENKIAVDLGGNAREAATICGTHLLISAGRRPNVEDLSLDEAGISYDLNGIVVDARLRTTNKRIFAIGDVTGGPQFTHAASYQAGIVIRNALFSLPKKVDYRDLPWVTYTDPELAQVGLTEAKAKDAGHDVTALIERFASNDRAQAERRTEGLAKVVLGKRGTVLGATVVGPHAGEMIGLWGLAIAQRLKLSAVASMIAPYPTLSEISKRAAASFFVPTLYGQGVRRLVRAVQMLMP